MGLRDLLEEKSTQLDKASAKERQEREKAVQKAQESGTDLKDINVQELRDKEQKARFKALKELLKQKYKRE